MTLKCPNTNVNSQRNFSKIVSKKYVPVSNEGASGLETHITSSKHKTGVKGAIS